MKITVNGKEYDSWADVPESERALLQQTLPDTNHDGTPDLFEGGVPPGKETFVQYTVNGQTYRSLEEMPPEIRASLSAAGLAAPNQPPAAPASPTPAGPLTLNGAPYDPNQKPTKRHWWNRPQP